MGRPWIFTVAVMIGCSLFIANRASGGMLYWSADGSPSASGGSGVWNASSLNWYAGVGPADLIWTNGDTAVFQGSSGTVTLGADGLLAAGLQFNSPGYTITGNGHTLNLASNSAISADNTTINAPLASSGPVSVSGALSLGSGGTLGQMNVTSGSTALTAGTLTLSDPNSPLTVGTSSTVALVSIQGGAILNSLGTDSVVDGTLGTGVVVDGKGSQFNTGAVVFEGLAATANITVQNGASMTNNGLLLVGAGGGTTGTLTIQSGGSAVTSDASIGYSGGATGTATVTGQGSTWNLTSLQLGGYQAGGGFGTLNILNGGAVITSGVTGVFPGGSITVNGGTLTTGLLNSPFSSGGSINLTDPAGGAALTINGASGSATYNGTITGSGSLVKSGASVQTLSNAGDTFSGTTTINGGSLILGTGMELQNSLVVLNTDNGLNLNGNSQPSIGGLSGNGALNLGNSMLNVGSPQQGYTSTYSGQLSATVNGNQAAGTLVVNGGSLTLSGGGTISSLFANGGLTTVSNATLNLTGVANNGSPLEVSGATLMINKGGQVISTGGSGQTAILEGGSVMVAGANSNLQTVFLFDGFPTFGTGTLNIMDDGAVNVSAGGYTLLGSGSSININGGTLTTGFLASVDANAGISLTDPAGGTALTLNGASGSDTYYGTFSGAGGTLLKTGAGTETLTGGGTIGQMNLYAGSTILSGGALTIANGSIGTPGSQSQMTVAEGAILNQTGTTLEVDGASGTSLVLTGAGSRINTAFQLLIGNFQNGTVTVQNGASMLNSAFLVVGTSAGGNGVLTVQSGGVVTTNDGVVGYLPGSTGAATVTGTGSAWNLSSLQIGGYSTAGGAGTLNITTGGAVMVTGTTTIFPAGSVTVDGATLTTGQLTVNGGVTVQNGGILNQTGNTLQVDGVTGANMIVTGQGSQVNTGYQLLVGNFQNGSVTVQNGASMLNSTFLVVGTSAGGNGTFTVQSGGVVTANDGVVGYLPGATGAATVTGPGSAWNLTSLQIAGYATAGGTGILNVTNGGAVTVAQTTTLFPQGSLVLNGGTLTTGQLNLMGGELTLSAGTLTLTGGAVELDGGTLTNNGTINGTVDVNSGGLAEGAGTYGVVNVNQGGTVHAGNSPGQLTSEAATWNAGGAFAFDIINATGMPGDDWGLWTITGALIITAGSTPGTQFTINLDTLTPSGAPGLLANFNPTQDYQWIFASAGNITGFAPSEFTINDANFANSLDGGYFYVTADGENLAVDFQAASTPEPGTWLLIMAALALIPLGNRRKFPVRALRQHFDRP